MHDFNVNMKMLRGHNTKASNLLLHNQQLDLFLRLESLPLSAANQSHHWDHLSIYTILHQMCSYLGK